MNILHTINLDFWCSQPYESAQAQLRDICQQVHQAHYQSDQRIVFEYTADQYVTGHVGGLLLRNLLLALKEVDISACFVVIRSTNPELAAEATQCAAWDPEWPAELEVIAGEFVTHTLDRHPTSLRETYQYGSASPLKVSLDQLSQHHRHLLAESQQFCIYPWIHIHVWPTGQAWPCCHANYQQHQYGSAREASLDELWNSANMRRLRRDMLAGTPNATCSLCYEQEASGFFSGRQSANKHHGHHVDRVDLTAADGTVEKMELTYWDIRFSNLCNLRCRSCGHIFSSQWYQDQARLAGPEWKLHNSVLNYAGKDESDMWTQLEPHLDYVEQIYFAGGEPLLMEEHYRILEELVRRGRFDVRLIYNTNFTHTDLKGRSVFDYWNLFDSVSVGASLDDMGSRAEYIRKGTAWAQVEKNREEMMQKAPRVDFYISPTLSIMNAGHLPKFHRTWVEKGYIKPQDLNVNILQDPAHYRIDIAPQAYKAELTSLYRQHIEWLKSAGDPLGRATQGFESAIVFMNATDNTPLIDTFWRKTNELDSIRSERCLDIIPELKALL